MDIINVMQDLKLPAPNDAFIYAVPFSWVGQQYPVLSVKNITTQNWAEAMTNVIEYFGLPGDRYITRFDQQFITFLFRSEEDATMCVLKFR